MDITEANGLVSAYEIKRRAVGLLTLFEGKAWGKKFTIQQAINPEAGKQAWRIKRQDGEEVFVTVDGALFSKDYGYTAWRGIMKNAIDTLHRQGEDS
jgi:hypothetical protein